MAPGGPFQNLRTPTRLFCGKLSTDFVFSIRPFGAARAGTSDKPTLHGKAVEFIVPHLTPRDLNRKARQWLWL